MFHFLILLILQLHFEMTSGCTPFEDNGELDASKRAVKIYKLDKGCCTDCSSNYKCHVDNVRCYYCGSKDYKNIINFAMYLDRDKNYNTLFCYDNWVYLDSCFEKYQSKKRKREYAKEDHIYYKFHKAPEVEDVFQEWFMQKEI